MASAAARTRRGHGATSAGEGARESGVESPSRAPIRRRHRGFEGLGNERRAAQQFACPSRESRAISLIGRSASHCVSPQSLGSDLTRQRSLAKRLLSSTAALAAALLVTGTPQARADQESRYLIGYEILLSGFTVGDIQITAEFSSNKYRILANTRNSGVLRLLAGFTSRAESDGRTNLGKVMPLNHRADNVWVGEKRYVRNAYDNDGGVRAEVVPSAADDGRDQVPEHQRAGTIDPLSAAFQASLWAGSDHACEDRLPVFDGRRRYDLHFRRLGEEEISGPFYSGTALRCHVRIDRIVGFSRTPWLLRSQASDTAHIWFATVVADLPPLPTRLRADLGLGTAEVILVSLTAAPNDHEPGPSAPAKSGSSREGGGDAAATQFFESRR